MLAGDFLDVSPFILLLERADLFHFSDWKK